MGKPQRRFGKEFEAEAVRLVEVSGRTQREIAMDLGVGLSTRGDVGSTSASSTRSRRCCPESAHHPPPPPPPELKRLRRENEILRQEREILKRAATFFAKEGSR